MLEPDVCVAPTFLTFGFFTGTVTAGGEDFTHLYDLLAPYSLGADIHC